MMKKLLLASAICSFSLLHSQTLLTENASALTVGNIGTDMTGATPGQGGWLTTVTAGNNSDFQVINAGGIYGNAIRLTGSNTAVNSRRMYKDVSAAWTGRGAGNNVAQVQFDFFTGPVTTSANSMRVALYDAALTKIIAGLTYVCATRELRGLGYYDNAGTVGNYSFTLGFNGTTYSAVTLNANTWYTLGFSFNYTTGELIFKEISGTLITAPPIMGASAATNVATFNLAATAISTSGQANSVAASNDFDNMDLRALAADSPLLRVESMVAAPSFRLYPNPASDVINIDANADVSSVTLTDVNGRIVKKLETSGQQDFQFSVDELKSGVYLMSLQTENGSITRKLIKQ